jgi:hypothetical protein
MLLTACQRQPETFAPPVQRQPLDDFRPYRAARIVKMNDADAEAFFTADIVKGPVDTTWRWTGKRPAITLHPRSVDGLVYEIEYAVPDVTFKATGPVNITFLVNNRALDTVHITAPGPQMYRKVVPPGWMIAGQPSELAAEIDKTYKSSLDGETLGFILTSIGLAQK